MKSFHCPILKSQKNQGFGRAYRSRFQNARGQAMIEYLLMLVIAVTIVIAFAMALFKPLGEFVDAINRSYLQCLLETGELPALKNDSQMSCPPPKLTTGGLDGGSSSGGPGGGSGGSSNNPNQTGNGDTAGNDGSGEGGEGGSGGGGGGGSSRIAGRKSTILRNGMRSKGNAQSEIGNSNQTVIPVENFEEGNGYMNLQSSGGSRRSNQQKSRQIALSGLTEYERKKAERKEQKVVTKPTEGETFTRAKNKKLVVKPPPPKEVVDQDQEFSGGFGYYFKIFFIVIILLFIFLLLGGQAFQLSKNWE